MAISGLTGVLILLALSGPSAEARRASAERWTTATAQGYSEVNFRRAGEVVLTFSCPVPQGGSGRPRLFLNLKTPHPVMRGTQTPAVIAVDGRRIPVVLEARASRSASGVQGFVATLRSDAAAAFHEIERMVGPRSRRLSITGSRVSAEAAPLQGVAAKLAEQKAACVSHRP